MLVRYGQGASTHGSFQTMVALVGGGSGPGTCALYPSSSCTLTDWSTPSTTQRRIIETVDIGTEPGLVQGNRCLEELRPWYKVRRRPLSLRFFDCFQEFHQATLCIPF